jgi:hypothetical protein
MTSQTEILEQFLSLYHSARYIRTTKDYADLDESLEKSRELLGRFYNLEPKLKISRTHKKFVEKIKKIKALTNPEDFLGPNWEDVINFWLYLDTLSIKEKNKMDKSYWALEWNVRYSAEGYTSDVAFEFIDEKVINACVGTFSENCWSVFRCATFELMGLHKLLEQGKSPTFLPLCLKP